MSKNCRQKFIVGVVYFVILSNLVGGACSIITRGVAPLSGLFLMLGVLAVAGGLVLLAGVLKRNDRYVLVYLILAIMVISFTTVLISVLVIPKAKELKGHVFLVVYLVLVIWWPILYCVYLFYKELLDQRVVVVETSYSALQRSEDKLDGIVVMEGSSRSSTV